MREKEEGGRDTHTGTQGVQHRDDGGKVANRGGASESARIKIAIERKIEIARKIEMEKRGGTGEREVRETQGV